MYVFKFLSIVLIITIFNYSFSQGIEEKQLNKLFLSLTSNLPSNDEKLFFNSIPQEKLKDVLIDSLLNKKDFYIFLESKFRNEYLESASIEYMHEQIKDFYFLTFSREKSIYHQTFKDNFDALNYLGMISLGQFKRSDVNLLEIKKNIFLNPIYDNINMGSFNYVVSSFQHLLNRKPTKNELRESIKMIEGNHGILFNTEGRSKKDFISIVLKNEEYKENQIKYWYAYFFNEEINIKERFYYMFADIESTESLIRLLLNKLWQEK